MNSLAYFSPIRLAQAWLGPLTAEPSRGQKITSLSDCPALTFLNFPYIWTQKAHLFSMPPDLVCILGTIPHLLIITSSRFQVCYLKLTSSSNPMMSLTWLIQKLILPHHQPLSILDPLHWVFQRLCLGMWSHYYFLIMIILDHYYWLEPCLPQESKLFFCKIWIIKVCISQGGYEGQFKVTYVECFTRYMTHKCSIIITCFSLLDHII